MAAAAILGAVITAAGEIVDAVGLGSSSSPYRPSYWSSGQMTTVTVPAQQAQNTATAPVQDASGNLSVNVGTTQSTSATVYVFDGMMKRQHDHRATPTRIPTQTGAAVTDHIIVEPVKVTLDVVMSDLMDSYTQGQWSGASSKSVAAFQVLEQLRLARQGLTISTRLQTYTNMALTGIYAIDDNETQFSLRAQVTFEQIIIGSISTQPLSARPQLTGSTNQGQIGTSTVPASVTNNNTVTTTSSIPGAGTLSSNPTGS